MGFSTPFKQQKQINHVAKSFVIALQCLQKFSGMNMEFFRCITANSNQYAWKHMNQSTFNFGGSKWCNIQLDEMVHFFGIVLKMSIDDS